ncbi:histone-lysine N-methyltransferase MECOM-like [Lytechinus variegatus]|uniref:histone-lysine N-methyltransferase MECOM-like n=1 Tax=Lytechinus variegatus TaxID=7654 RepID=UPI001BB0F371|nr:histone-lysine N-methyltransferase MECOM-like [Lytechinus variegatus]
MEKEDNGNGIQAQESTPETSSDSKNEAEVNEIDLAPTENPDTESMGNEKEKDEECDILEVGDSPNQSPPSPEGGDADGMNDQDPQDLTENKNNGNAEEKVGPTSISLSTLISTIIKGTVASMDDVGVGKQGFKEPPLPLPPGEIVSSTQLQDEALSSASDNPTGVTNLGQETVLHENTDEVLEHSLPPAYHSVMDTKRRGPDRRPRMQNRFSLSRMGTYEEPLEVPKTETIDTEGGKIYQCLSCKVSFNYEQDMQMHLQTHLRPRYFCPVCSKRFLNQSTLERHMVTHEQTKPFVCSICSQGFRIKSNLNRHYQRIHNSKVDLGEPRRGRPVSSVPRSNMPHPVDTLPKAKFPIQTLGMVPRSISHPYQSPASYKDSQISATNLAAPPIDFNPSLRYEQVSNHQELENNTVSSADHIVDFPQPLNKFELDHSPYVNPETSDKPDLQKNQPNTSLTQSRVSSMNSGDEEDSHAHLFLSRYPDVESAVDAIRRIETERLFHQELLLEELKLRRKYGLPSSNVLEDLKKEIALKEKIGDMDSLIAQGGSDFGRAEALKNANSLIDPKSMTGNTSPRTSPSYDDSFQADLSRGAYLLGGQSGHQERDNTSRGTPSDLINQSLLTESQASAQLRRLSAFNTVTHAPYQPDIEKGSPSILDMPTSSHVQLSSPHVSDESSNDWSASQHLRSFTSRFGRPRRGRRRLASMPPSLPSHYADESEIQQQDASFGSRKQGSPAPFSPMLVHHRPSLPHNSSRQMKPPPTILRPPPLPFRSPQNSSHRFPSVTTLPPPPDYVLPSSPQRPTPKRFRPALAKTMRTELQRLEDFANQREIEPIEAMQTGYDNQPTKPTQVSPVYSKYASAHVDTVTNPFTMSGPPNRSVKPNQSQSSLKNPNPQTAFNLVIHEAPSRLPSNQVSSEADSSPLDLSCKI